VRAGGVHECQEATPYAFLIWQGEATVGPIDGPEHQFRTGDEDSSPRQPPRPIASQRKARWARAVQVLPGGDLTQCPDGCARPASGSRPGQRRVGSAMRR